MTEAELSKIAAFRQWITAKPLLNKKNSAFVMNNNLRILTMTSRFMLIFAAISGFIFSSGRFWRACVK